MGCLRPSLVGAAPGWFEGVGLAERAGEGAAAVGVASVAPAAVGFGVVVLSAERPEVVPAGVPAVSEVVVVVDVAAFGGLVAAGPAADGLAGPGMNPARRREGR